MKINKQILKESLLKLINESEKVLMFFGHSRPIHMQYNNL